MKKKFILIIFGIILIFCVGYRIWFVNQNARLPEYQIYSQEESVEYKGLNYNVISATMMNYDDFFRDNPEYIDYYNTSISNKKVILVDYKVELATDTPVVVETYIPITYAYCFNGFDPFLFNEMNPTLMEGTFKSGDKITIMYEIYDSNLTDKQWQDVENLEYRLVFGTYPVRKEIVLSDIDYR